MQKHKGHIRILILCQNIIFHTKFMSKCHLLKLMLTSDDGTACHLSFAYVPLETVSCNLLSSKAIMVDISLENTKIIPISSSFRCKIINFSCMFGQFCVDVVPDTRQQTHSSVGNWIIHWKILIGK